MAGPLFELTKKDVVFVWSQDCQRAFDDLKKALLSIASVVLESTIGAARILTTCSCLTL
jgi:hypothetical protein